jgi:hypothetical protein
MNTVRSFYDALKATSLAWRMSAVVCILVDIVVFARMIWLG